jgi:oxygen-independent coproporphyrinogen-3 oxidase
VASAADYVNRVNAAQSVWLDRRRLDEQEQLEDALFMGLRLVDGVDLLAVNRRYGVDVWERYGAELERFVCAGLLIHKPGASLALTRAGMLLANEVMAVFIGRPVR